MTIPKTKSNIETPWWQTGIIYQIYVRSFCDSNGDGVGDLPGVIGKLDYLKEIGIDAIWLSPVTVSANADWGYDVTDYYNIDPTFGTMEDFEWLIVEARKRNIKVLSDFVPNHTSVKHPWFQDALSGRDAKYRDYYIWTNPKPGNKPPNNWRSWFGGSAWAYHKPTNQYYLHNFLPQQADLNWRNPAVRDEFDKIIQFWLNKGIDGFRIDVFNMLVKDSQLRDNPKSQQTDDVEVRLFGQKPTYTTSRPEIHRILRRWRKIADSYPERRLLLGETTMVYNVRQVAAFYGSQDELELAFNFNFLRSKFEAAPLRQIVAQTEKAIKYPDWPVWTCSNHDERARFSSRWAGGDERKIRAGLLMLLTLRGTPVMYYGDEIGLQNVYVPPWRLKDPWGKRYWPVFGGRDRARTPMPWRLAPGAGFTDPDARPWLPYGRLQEHNVEQQDASSDSTLGFTRRLIALRRTSGDLKTGDYKSLPTQPEVWAWERGKNTIVLINFSDSVRIVEGVNGSIALSTLRTHDATKVTDRIELQPWEAIILVRSTHSR